MIENRATSKEERIHAVLSRMFSFDLEFITKIADDLMNSKSVTEEKEVIKMYLAQSIDDCDEYNCSPTLLHKELKSLNGLITEYAKNTKNKIDEIELSLLVLNKLLELGNKCFLNLSSEKTFQFYKSIIIKTYKLLILISKLKEFNIESISSELEKLGNLIGNNPKLMRLAINTQLNVNWLIFSEIPQDIDLCFKQVKESGVLK